METKPPARADLALMLHSHGVKPTMQRLAIAAVLLTRPQHLSAEQVLSRAMELSRHISKATVYNTLRLFTERGLVREVVVDPTRIYYDSNTTAHHHLYDATSGSLTDLPPEDIRVEGLPELPPQLELASVEVIVRTRPRRA